MDRLPVLPLGQLVVYPHVVLPLALTDSYAAQLIDEVVQGNKRVLLGVVRPVGGTEPPEGAVMQARADELYEVGTLSTVVRMLKLGDGSVRVMVQGLDRARLVEITPAQHWLVSGSRSPPPPGGYDHPPRTVKCSIPAQISPGRHYYPHPGDAAHQNT